MAWLPDGAKNSKTSLFVLTQLTNVTDRHTHRETSHDGIGRVYAAHRATKMTPRFSWSSVSVRIYDSTFVSAKDWAKKWNHRSHLISRKRHLTVFNLC